MIKKFFIVVFFLVPIFAQGSYLNKSFPKIEGISLSGNKVTKSAIEHAKQLMN
mgnify:CR=1 FL=1